MKVKKIAVRGLIVLALAVAVCMFFSETIHTIVTPKVRITSPRQGRLSQNVHLSASLTFLESHDIRLTGVEGASVRVRSVKVAPGYQVKQGDLLAECELTDYEASMKQLRTEYETSQKQLETLNNKNITLRRTEKQWADAYIALKAANERELDARLKLNALMRLEGIEISDTGELPAKASEQITSAYNEYIESSAAQGEARAQMSIAERYTPSEEIINFIIDSEQATKNMARLEEAMIALSVMSESIKQVRAPYAGYITSVNAKSGEAFDMTGALMTICPISSLPVLRASTANSALTINKGMSATLTSRNGWSIDSHVISLGVTLEGDQYADIELTSGTISDMGGTYAMMKAEVPITISHRATYSTTLLPTSAVRGSGEDRYVYTLRRESGAFGVSKLVVYKTSVKVLAEADGVTSIEEDLSYQQIAYMEDRPISENSTVMEYVN